MITRLSRYKMSLAEQRARDHAYELDKRANDLLDLMFRVPVKSRERVELQNEISCTTILQKEAWAKVMKIAAHKKTR